MPELPLLPHLILSAVKDPTVKDPSVEATPSKDRQKHMQSLNSFRKMVQGPTDKSSWIVPGRVLMGSIPLGRASDSTAPLTSHIQTRHDAISQVLLSGVNVFISLMEQKEELSCISEYNLQAGRSSLSGQHIIESIAEKIN